jgi:hypothetical protein
MIFVGPYLSNPNCHFNMNVVDSLGSKNDLVIDIKEEIDYLEKIKYYLKDKNIEDEIIIYNPFEKENFVIVMKREIPKLRIYMYCSDDEWRCFNYDRYLALYVDFFSITAKKHLPLYEKWGFENVIGTNWACNPNKFYPLDVVKKYDVTFIGAPYGKRIDYVREAIRNNINIKVFGKGWNKFKDIKPYWGGFVSSKEMNIIINESKINLNFMWSSKGGYQVKGRNFELSGCNVFQLCNYGDELLDYFTPQETIDTFNNKKNFIDKINYYLENEEIRENIAQNSYKTTMNEHTWGIKFDEIFEFGKDKQIIQDLPKFKVLINVKKDVKHNILNNDQRLDIYFKDTEKHYDGMIELKNHSTINNDTLYLMAFALYADKSDIVLSNFYINNIWIRLRDFKIKKNKYLINLFPSESIMYKSKDTVNKRIATHKEYSYIEYPTYEINSLNFIIKIILRLLFSSYHQVEKFNEYKNKKNFIGMSIIAYEYFTRKIFIK